MELSSAERCLHQLWMNPTDINTNRINRRITIRTVLETECLLAEVTVWFDNNVDVIVDEVNVDEVEVL